MSRRKSNVPARKGTISYNIEVTATMNITEVTDPAYTPQRIVDELEAGLLILNDPLASEVKVLRLDRGDPLDRLIARCELEIDGIEAEEFVLLDR